MMEFKIRNLNPREWHMGTTATEPQNETGVASQTNNNKKRKQKNTFQDPMIHLIKGDARNISIPNATVDMIITSPPYWKKRNYGMAGQIGQEATVEGYLNSLIECMREWRRVLRTHGSVFINLDEKFHEGILIDIPGLFISLATKEGWDLCNRIIWTKPQGMPTQNMNRLAHRHEYILHFALNKNLYFFDKVAFKEFFNEEKTPTSIWTVVPKAKQTKHLAPFPEELVKRAIVLAAPGQVCEKCGVPRRRIISRGEKLNLERPQARRALELAKIHGLTDEHIAAIRATGICDAGKAQEFQSGFQKNSAKVKKLASEAKRALGGYFREFTFAIPETTGWTTCECGVGFSPGTVLDPFMGTGTTLRVTKQLGFKGIGVDLDISHYYNNT